MKYARERAFLKKGPLPRAPSLRDVGRGTLGGEAASLREAPLPQTPSPEERLALELGRFCLLGSACEVSALSDRLGCGHGERNPSARFAGTSPFRGGFSGPPRRKVAAALSAAVTTTKQQGTALNFQGHIV